MHNSSSSYQYLCSRYINIQHYKSQDSCSDHGCSFCLCFLWLLDHIDLSAEGPDQHLPVHLCVSRAKWLHCWSWPRLSCVTHQRMFHELEVRRVPSLLFLNCHSGRKYGMVYFGLYVNMERVGWGNVSSFPKNINPLRQRLNVFPVRAARTFLYFLFWQCNTGQHFDFKCFHILLSSFVLLLQSDGEA